LLVCQPLNSVEEPEGTPVVALDALGASMHQRVVVSTDGSAARIAVKDPNSPARMMIVGIVDSISTGANKS